MGDSKKDLRQAPRAKGPWPAKVTLGGKSFTAVCKDISIIGLGFVGLPVLMIGAEVKVRVELGPLWVVETAALVVRQQPDAAAPEVGGQRLITGMRFMRLDPKTLGLLHEALASR